MAKKLSISLRAETAAAAELRAREQQKPLSRYVAELIEQDLTHHRDVLAVEGYRLLGAQNLEFAESGATLAQETWPRWKE